MVHNYKNCIDIDTTEDEICKSEDDTISTIQDEPEESGSCGKKHFELRRTSRGHILGKKKSFSKKVSTTEIKRVKLNSTKSPLNQMNLSDP